MPPGNSELRETDNVPGAHSIIWQESLRGSFACATRRKGTRPLSELTKLDIAATEELDWTQADPETTAAKVRLLTAIASYFNVLSLTDFGGRVAPARDPRLAENASPEQAVALCLHISKGDVGH